VYHFWGPFGGHFVVVSPPGGPLNLVRLIVLQTTSYIMSFKFLCTAVQKFYFGRFLFPKTSKFGQIYCLPNTLLHWVVRFNFLCVAAKKFYFLGGFWGAILW